MAEIKKSKGGDDLRQVERNCIVFYLRVFDGLSSKIVGHLVDISSKGLMLVSDDPIATNEDYRLRMRLPAEIKDSDEVLISATSRWCRQDENPKFYRTGFQMHDLPGDVAKTIQNLIKKCGYESTP